MAAEKTRYGWLDVMKLIGIYFVWAAHREGMGRYGLFFLSIVLGVLFFASGFSAARRAQTPVSAFIREKFLRVMVPYFSFSILTLAARVLLEQMTLGEIIDWVRRMLWASRANVPVTALWFLPCLFWMSVYYQLLLRAIKKPAARLAVCFAVSAAVKLIHEGPLLPWGIEQAGRFRVYYELGDMAARWLARARQRGVSRAGVAALALVTAAQFYVLYTNFYFGTGSFPSLLGVSEVSYPVQSLLTFFYQCNGIWCVAAASMALAALPGLCRAGRATLVFCGVESLAKTILPLALEGVGLSFPELGGAAALVQTALLMAAAYYLMVLPVTRYFPWMLGKPRPGEPAQRPQASSGAPAI